MLYLYMYDSHIIYAYMISYICNIIYLITYLYARLSFPKYCCNNLFLIKHQFPLIIHYKSFYYPVLHAYIKEITILDHFSLIVENT